MPKKAWVENGLIYLTDDPTVAVEGMVEVPDWVTLWDLKIVDGRVVVKSEEERLQELKQAKLQELKQYVSILLSLTDWVIIKLHSLRLEGTPENVIEQETQKYASLLEKRQRIRAWNEEIERAILEAETVEELQAIKIEFAE